MSALVQKCFKHVPSFYFYQSRTHNCWMLWLWCLVVRLSIVQGSLLWCLLGHVTYSQSLDALCYGVFWGHVTNSQWLDALCYGVFWGHVADSYLLDALCYGFGAGGGEGEACY